MANVKLEWQPIETAPKDGTNFLGGRWNTGEFGHVYWSSLVCWWRDSHNGGGNVGWVTQPGAFAWNSPTHWMPLPEPPEDAR